MLNWHHENTSKASKVFLLIPLQAPPVELKRVKLFYMISICPSHQLSILPSVSSTVQFFYLSPWLCLVSRPRLYMAMAWIRKKSNFTLTFSSLCQISSTFSQLHLCRFNFLYDDDPLLPLDNDDGELVEVFCKVLQFFPDLFEHYAIHSYILSWVVVEIVFFSINFLIASKANGQGRGSEEKIVNFFVHRTSVKDDDRWNGLR